MAFIWGRGVIKRRERRDMLYFFFHSQQTGSEGEGGAAGISTVVLRCAGEVDLKQISILSGRYMMLGFVILHYRAVYQCVFISLWAQIQCTNSESSAWHSSPLYRNKPFSIFLLQLLMQSYFSCSR